jgi:mannose-6-phosphate isomerase-like protein (cupin superfamily)
MTDAAIELAGPRVLGPDEGEVRAFPDGTRDRYLIDRAETGSFSLVEHVLAPRALAAPLHRHTREDEYSFVLEGQVGAVFGGQEVLAGPGHLIRKPRGEWHTFWNAGDTSARMLELISPGGLEELFRVLGDLGGYPEPDELVELAARYGCDVDVAGTMPIVERHRLTF